MEILRGRTSQTIPVKAVDTNGIPKTGLVFNTSGLACVYKRELDASPTTITLATMTAGTWATGGFIEENSTSMPGVYEFGIPNAVIGSGDASTWVVIQFVGTNVFFQPLRIDLVAYNPQNANLGLSNVSANVAQWNGTNVATPATAGVPDVNAKNINNVSTSSVTTINANQGTTQPVNFTGTGASALAKSDMVDVAGSAVNAAAAQLGVNVVNVGGAVSAGSAGYVGLDWGHINAPTTAVDLSGTTVKNVDNAIANVTNVATVTGNVNGNVAGSVGSVTGNVGGNVVGSVGSVVATVAANLTQILGTALTETTVGWLAAAFKKFFNLATPTSTMNEITLVDTTTNVTNAVPVGNVTLAASQPLYAPAKAGDQMDLVNAPNATAVTAIQNGLSKPATAQTIDQTKAIGTPTAGTIAEALSKADSLAFTVPNQVDSNVIDWKSATAPAMTGDAYARIGAGGAGLTSLGDARIANLDATVGSRSTYAGGPVASVTGDVNGNVVGSVGSVLATVAANLTQILGTALTETAGLLAAGFKKFFNVPTPTSTMNEITLVDTTTNLTNAVPVGNVTLAASQPLYAPAKAGDQMDLVNAPNSTAIAAIQNGLLLDPSIVIARGTAQAVSATSLTLQAGTVGNFKGLMLHIKTGSNSPQAVPITAYSGLVATVASWNGGTPSSNATYEIVISGGSGGGSGGDPLATVLPNGYTGDQAGAIIFATYQRVGVTPINVIFNNPVSASQTAIGLIRGDSYEAVDLRALIFAAFPGQVIVSCTLDLGTTPIPTTTIVGTPIADGTQGQFELTSAQSGALSSGWFHAKAVLSTGNLVTLGYGPLTMTSGN